ncbi:hypothetical protein ACHHYP_01053 [Achlya hypogyna]|uniref:Hyaluronan-mediated motility receptor C-terminal domain-containing protein n=1 Tax=Achlya hypogyna TaxID=1202772 RepID=A0A1V9ZTX0_ACHHY|nr:hypothetical protein ACHHYP_01053 [Achlya hypogyna]
MAPPPPTDVTVLCLRLQMRKMQHRVTILMEALAKATLVEPQSSPSKETLRPAETDKMIADLVVEVERLKLQLHERSEETTRLAAKVDELRAETASLTEINVSLASNVANLATENAALRIRLESDEVDAELSPSKTDGVGSTVGDEDDSSVTDLREALHALALERDQLAKERDEAQAATARALKENSRLAGHSNGQQRIKYVQTLKEENNRLTIKLREAEVRVARLEARKPLANPILSKHVDVSKPRSTTSLSPSHSSKKRTLQRPKKTASA